MSFRTVITFTTADKRTQWLNGLQNTPDAESAKQEALRLTTQFVRDNLISVEAYDVDAEREYLRRHVSSYSPP
jgi:hypothetical protein